MAADPTVSSPKRMSALDKSRVDSRRSIWRWLILAALIVFAGLVISLVLQRAAQVSLIADFMLIVMVLCPMVLCFAPLAIGLWVAVFAMTRLDGALSRQLDRLEGATQSLSDRTAKAGDALSRQSIGLTARFAILDRFFNAPDSAEPSSSELTSTKKES